MADHGFGGWDSAPGCVQHNVPGSEGVYKAYEKCTDFFTFGPGSTIGTSTDGVATSYWVLTALGFFGGYIPAWLLKQANLLRVPPEVELEGLDMAEFQADFYPEFDRPTEVIVLPDGSEVASAPVLLEGYRELITTNGRRAPERVRT